MEAAPPSTLELRSIESDDIAGVQAIYGSQASVNAPYGLPRLGPEFGAFGVLSVLVLLTPTFWRK